MRKSQLQKHLIYDVHTGIFLSRKSHEIVGDIGSNGYIYIWLDGNRYKAHELAWLYVHGSWPKKEVIHIDGIKHNNWLNNLKLKQGVKVRSDNITGFTGVSWDRRDKSWRASISSNGKQKNLGNHKNMDNAVMARAKAEQEMGIVDSPAQQYIKNIFL